MATALSTSGASGSVGTARPVVGASVAVESPSARERSPRARASSPNSDATATRARSASSDVRIAAPLGGGTFSCTSGVDPRKFTQRGGLRLDGGQPRLGRGRTQPCTDDVEFGGSQRGNAVGVGAVASSPTRAAQCQSSSGYIKWKVDGGEDIGRQYTAEVFAPVFDGGVGELRRLARTPLRGIAARQRDLMSGALSPGNFKGSHERQRIGGRANDGSWRLCACGTLRHGEGEGRPRNGSAHVTAERSRAWKSKRLKKRHLAKVARVDERVMNVSSGARPVTTSDVIVPLVTPIVTRVTFAFKIASL